MAAVKKIPRKASKKSVVVSKKVKDYSKASFFVKKAREMETILKKHGTPEAVSH